MFYTKSDFAEGVTIRTEITDENVFTVCPGCGGEHQVDLQEAIMGGNLDILATVIYCAECSAKIEIERQNRP